MNIFELAKQAGFQDADWNYNKGLAKFADLVAIESYDKGVEDAKQEAIIALEKTVAVMVAAEREACAKLCEPQEAHDDPLTAWKIAKAIRARGTT